MPKYKFIDLFCGIGGFHVALERNGCECVYACDVDKFCRETYLENYGIEPDGDITQVKIKDIPKFDILCAGFPCQPFSKAGYQKGFDDDRGNLFYNICKIVKKHKPKYMILENVRNLASHDKGNTWNVIHKNITKLGYYTYDRPVILNVLHFNVPQNRERVVIMCKRMDLGELPQLPEISKNPKQFLTTHIKDIVDPPEKDSEISGKDKEVAKIWNKYIKLLEKNNISVPKYPIWTDWWDTKDKKSDFYVKYKNWIDKNRQFYKDNKTILKPWLEKSRKNEYWKGAVRKFEWQAGDLQQGDGMYNTLWTSRGSGIRVKRADYIPTLVAMSMIPVYGPENRKLTPKELLKLQGFPEGFKYNEKKIMKQLGNAVNVDMIDGCYQFLIKNKKLIL